MATNKIAIRTDTAANWTSANPVLETGEQGHETDTGRRKIGDGSTAWNSLDYSTPGLAANNTFTGDNTFTGSLNIYNPQGFFKTDSDKVAFKKTAAYEVQTSQLIRVVVNDVIVEIAEDTAVTMGSTPSVGSDMAIWIMDDGSLQVSANFSTLTNGVRVVGGFHHAPGGNATLDPDGDWSNHTGGDTTPQINEYSIWDLKWRPSARDPRGLALVPGLQEWWGIYPMQNGIEAGPLHMYGVDPCRDGNAPYKIWADNSPPDRYTDATPMNIFELLASQGFRPPQPWNFQLAALGTTEQTSVGGSGPGNTGDVGDRDRDRFTSAWGLFDITGVIRTWGSDSLPDNTQTGGVTQGRSNDIFRISRFAALGGYWNLGSSSGSRCVLASTSSVSGTDLGGRGVCSHCIIP
ncbi:MAG: hypothetical protein LAT68_14220 [Cyclobacteriaceae bacterium]|nr:hypothetical protein [Cyclobacteriaceae bacterium]